MDDQTLLRHIQELEDRLDKAEARLITLERSMSSSDAATSGNDAEDLFASDPRVHTALLKYHSQNAVVSSESLGGSRKKTDVRFTFDTNTTMGYQLKNSDSPGYAGHLGRKPLEEYTADEELRTTLRTFLLEDRQNPQIETPNPFAIEVGKRLIRETLLGLEKEYEPTHMVHVVSDRNTIKRVFICPIQVLLKYFEDKAHVVFNQGKKGIKITRSITLSPGITIQRRGSEGYYPDGTPKGRPDDIQTKIGITQTLLSDIFTELPLE